MPFTSRYNFKISEKIRLSSGWLALSLLLVTLSSQTGRAQTPNYYQDASSEEASTLVDPNIYRDPVIVAEFERNADFFIDRLLRLYVCRDQIRYVAPIGPFKRVWPTFAALGFTVATDFLPISTDIVPALSDETEKRFRTLMTGVVAVTIARQAASRQERRLRRFKDFAILEQSLLTNINDAYNGFESFDGDDDREAAKSYALDRIHDISLQARHPIVYTDIAFQSSSPLGHFALALFSLACPDERRSDLLDQVIDRFPTTSYRE